MDQKKSLKIGILGGGQLAQMLIQNNPFFDASFYVYSESLECPANQTDAHIHVGSMQNTEQLKSFLSEINFLTFENEFINVELLNELRRDFPKLFILPDLKLLQILQNKLYQKFEFQKLNLPTSKFFAFNPELDDLTKWLQNCYQNFHGKFVLKWAFGGYDGRGNYVIQSTENLIQAIAFCKNAFDKGSTVYAEEFVSFKKEVAQIYVRSLKGEFINYPLVVSEQENNICKLVYGPAVEFDVPSYIEEQTNQIGKILAEKLNYVGTFAIEYFLTNDNEILINEMAPRVHNSGHYTLDACRDNQFSQHTKAVLGGTLSSPITYNFFAMRNILGPKDSNGLSSSEELKKLPQSEDVKIYWYNKQKVKPFRKMGHINTIAMTKDDLNRKIKIMKDIEDKLWSLYEK